MLRAFVIACVAVCVLSGCGAGTRSAQGVVRALVDAAQIGDRDKVLSFLGPKTRARLAARSKAAGELAGRRGMKDSEMLAVGWGAPRFLVTNVSIIESSDERALVEVRGARGVTERYECVRTVDGWKVELPE